MARRTILLLGMVAGTAGSSDAALPGLRGAQARRTAEEPAETSERCHAAIRGERCYTAVMWAKDHGISLHPDWYPSLTAESSFEDFQAHLHALNYDDCPKPCDHCHTAVEGEECYTAVMWAKMTGIGTYPEWYPELTQSSSFELFQAHLHALRYDNCPAPCEEVEDPPEARCRTATEGEQCYTAAMWAMQHGIRLHPEWYPKLTQDSSFEDFQAHLHDLHYDDCPQPCAPPPPTATSLDPTTTAAKTTTQVTTAPPTTVRTTTAPPTTVRTTTPGRKVATTTAEKRQKCSLSISVWHENGMGNREHLPDYSVWAGWCKLVDPKSMVYATAEMPTEDCNVATLGKVQWYEDEECSGTPLASMVVFTEGDVTRSGCRDKLSNLVEGGKCQGFWYNKME